MTSQMNRENKLILLLSKQKDYMTSEELAILLETSTKTIYRLIKKINLEFPNGHLILAEKGRGYKLDYGKFIEQTNELNKPSVELSPAERQDRVMEELLMVSPKALKITELFRDYYVGDSAIANDEKQIAKKIKKFDLELIRKNRTLAIQGSETNIRRGIAEVIWRMNILDIDEINRTKELNFNRYDVLFVSEQLKLIEKTLGGGIPYPYNVNIFSHLYIMISRSRKTNYQIKEIELSTEQLQSLDHESPIYEMAMIVIQNVERYLVTRLPMNEVYYLYQYLVSSRMEKQRKRNRFFQIKYQKLPLIT